MSNEVAEQNLSAKAKWADQIQQSLNEGDYSKAKVLAQKALGEFPNDADLLALEEEAIHARERSAQAHQLMEEGCQLFDDGAFEEAVQVLRNGFALDERSKAIRSALLNCLVRYATEMMKTDLHKARNVVQEAMCIEPENPAVTRLIDEVRKARPATPVDQNASSSERISEAKTPAVVPLMREKAVQAKSATAEPAPGGCAADIQSKLRPAVPGMAPRTPAMPQQKTGNIVHEKNMPAAPPAGAPKLGTTSEPASDTKQTAQVPLPLPPPPKKMQFNVTGILSKTGSAAITPAPAKNSGEPAPAAVVAAPLAGSAPASALSSQPIASALPSTQSNAAETRVTAPDSPVAAEKVPNAAESPAVQPAPQAKAQEKALRHGPKLVRFNVLAKKHQSSWWKWLAAAVALLVGGALLARKHTHQQPPAPSPVLVEIRTNPPGAQVTVNGAVQDVSQPVSFPPGTYHIEAKLDGFQPVVQDVTINDQSRGPFDLVLAPVQPSVRVTTDLEAGSVLLDGNPIGELQDGQFSLGSAVPGKHTLQIATRSSSEVTIPFELSSGAVPSLTDSITAKNARVILVGNYQGRGRVYSNFGPAPLSLDGQPSGAIPSSGGLDISNLSAGEHRLVITDGKKQRTIPIEIAPAAGLFVFVNSDRNIGTLEIVSNMDGFDVLVNGKPRKAVKQKGHYFIYNLDAAAPVSVQLTKKGFLADPAEQRINIQKGETSTIYFKLTAVPTTAILRVLGALPGTRIVVDGEARELQADGTFGGTVTPGDHVLELTRPGYKAKSFRVIFKPGQTVTVSGNDALLDVAATGKLVITARTPASAKVVLRRADGSEISVGDREADLAEGEYTLVASAPGYHEILKTVRLAEGAPASVDIRLVPFPQAVHMEGWEDAGSWKSENGWYSRKGGPFVLFKTAPANGTFQFTARHGGRQFPIFRGGRLQWVVNFVDARNYDLYQIDKEKFYFRRFTDGKPGPEVQAAHSVNIKNDSYSLMVEIAAGRLVQKLYDGQAWKTLPQLGESTGQQGKFGFYLPGNDEIRLTDFEYTPKE